MEKVDLSQFHVVDNKELSQFQLVVNGYVSKIEYSLKEGKLFLIHTEVPEELAGQGIAAYLAKGAFQLIEEQGKKIVPMCSYINTYLRKHPEFQKFLVAGIKIE